MHSLDSLGRAYRVVYDAGAHYPFDRVLLIPIAMFGIGLGTCIYLACHGGTSRRDGFTRGFMVVWTFAAGLIGLGILSESYNRFVYYRDSLRAGRVDVVEGVVSHFEPEPPEGHRDESFDVSGQHFQYSRYVLNSGFNHTMPAGGPIREGLRVRIAYLDGAILRLEIADR